MLKPLLFRWSFSFMAEQKMAKYCRTECGWQNKIIPFDWGRFTSMHGYGATFVPWMLTTDLRRKHCQCCLFICLGLIQTKRFACLVWFNANETVSFESNLDMSLKIVVYVRKNVVAFYRSIFLSCTSVPLKRCTSVLKHALKRCENRWTVSHIVGVSKTIKNSTM